MRRRAAYVLTEAERDFFALARLRGIERAIALDRERGQVFELRGMKALVFEHPGLGWEGR